MFFPKNNYKYKKLLIKIIFVIGILLFKIILDKYYEVYGPLFGYLGLKFLPQEESIVMGVYFLLIFIAFILPLNHKKPSNVFLLFLFLMSYVPVAVIYSYDKSASLFGFLAYTFFMIGLSLLDKIKIKSLKFKNKTLSTKSFNWMLFGLISISIVILVSHYGIKLNVKSYDDIYDVRANFKELTQKSRLLAFSFGWMSNVFTIVLLTISVVKKRWILALTAVLLQLYLFNLGGNKSIFMLPIFLVFIIFSIKVFKEYMPLFVLLSFLILTYGLYFYDFVINDHFSTVSSILIRRNFFVPANLYYYYLEFFETQPHDFFAKSFPFSLFMESNYISDVPEIIGAEYIRKGTHANGNFLADLFYNYSWIGYFIGFTVISIYFKIVDSIVKNKNHLIIVPIATVPVISLMNSGLIVNLISFGLVMITIILILYPTEKHYINT